MIEAKTDLNSYSIAVCETSHFVTTQYYVCVVNLSINLLPPVVREYHP